LLQPHPGKCLKTVEKNAILGGRATKQNIDVIFI
jgi:hypothetical protein